MKIILYKYSGEIDKINKVLPSGYSITGRLVREETVDELMPNIEIEFNGSPLDYTYCYIEEFKRYYFCTWENNTYNKWTLKCDADDLYNWRSVALNTYCVIEGVDNTVISNPNIANGQYTCTPETYNEVIEFPHELFDSTPHILLSTI